MMNDDPLDQLGKVADALARGGFSPPPFPEDAKAFYSQQPDDSEVLFDVLLGVLQVGIEHAKNPLRQFNPAAIAYTQVVALQTLGYARYRRGNVHE